LDDPAAARGNWTHWIAYNIPPDAREIEENQPRSGPLTNGGLQGLNSWDALNYGGPCPPPETTHTYRLFLYALDFNLPLEEGATKNELLAAMESHVLAERLLTGTYSLRP